MRYVLVSLFFQGKRWVHVLPTLPSWTPLSSASVLTELFLNVKSRWERERELGRERLRDKDKEKEKTEREGRKKESLKLCRLALCKSRYSMLKQVIYNFALNLNFLFTLSLETSQRWKHKVFSCLSYFFERISHSGHARNFQIPQCTQPFVKETISQRHSPQIVSISFGVLLYTSTVNVCPRWIFYLHYNVFEECCLLFYLEWVTRYVK